MVICNSYIKMAIIMVIASITYLWIEGVSFAGFEFNSGYWHRHIEGNWSDYYGGTGFNSDTIDEYSYDSTNPTFPLKDSFRDYDNGELLYVLLSNTDINHMRVDIGSFSETADPWYSLFKLYSEQYESSFAFSVGCNYADELGDDILINMSWYTRGGNQSVKDITLNGVHPYYVRTNGTPYNGELVWSLPIPACGSTMTFNPSGPSGSAFIGTINSIGPHFNCDIQVTKLESAYSASGVNIIIDGAISSIKPIVWELSLPGGRIISGNGSSVSVTWDGKDLAGKLLPEGKYIARLTAQTNHGKCSTTKNVQITVKKSCNLKISDFQGSSQIINPEAGGSINVSGNITDGSVNLPTWNISVDGKIYPGIGFSPSVIWDGMDAHAKVIEPGSYTATLSAQSGDGICSDTKSINFTAVPAPEGQCGLFVQFGSSAHVADGALTHSQELFTLKNGSIPAGLTLNYNSRDGYSGSLGTGWSHIYDISLRQKRDGSVVLYEGSGRRKLYTLSNSLYVSQPGDYSSLVKNADSTFSLTKKDGMRYIFGADARIAAIIDRNGNAVTLGYSGGNLTTITDPVGRLTTLAYDAVNHLASVTDPLGSGYTFGFNDNTLTSVTYPDGGTWSFTYDANASMLSKTDPSGNSTNYSYDGNHRVISATDPEGRIRNIAYPQTTDTVKTTAFTEKDGGVWSYSYDTQRGYLLAKTDPQGGVSRYTYDSDGNRTATTLPDGTVTSATYDARGNMLISTDAMGQITGYTYNGFGQILSITDPQGGVTAYAYDAKGNLVSIMDFTGTSTSYGFDAKGNLTQVIAPTGATTRYGYDGQNNLISVTAPTGAMTRFSYDAAGNVTSNTDPQGGVTYYTYDASGHLIKTVDPLGNIATYTYDLSGNKSSDTDANGNTTKYEYSAQNQMTRTINALNATTSYSYGGSTCPSCGGGNGEKLTSLTDTNGNTTMYLYDQLGRLTTETDPLGNITSYRYNAKGNLTARTDANGATIGYSYDGNGRLLKKSYPDGSEETFTYDAKGNMLTAANRNISASFTYDAAGRMTSSTDNSGRTIRYGYDSAGRKNETRYPEGSVVGYAYDSFGRLATITNGGTYTFGYNDSGQRTTLSYPNGDIATYNYNNSNLTGITRENSIGAIIASNSYTHDKVGNRLTNTTSERTNNYGYDNVYRLLQTITNTPGISSNAMATKGTTNAVQQQKDIFTYDSVGNRLTSNDRSYTYNPNNQLVTNGGSYRYDKNGNLTQKTTAEGTTTYIWDFENRLIKVVTPTATAEYAYGPLGKRIRKKTTENGTTTTANYFYDGPNIILEYDDSGTVTNRYLHGPNIDEPFSITIGKETYYYHADGLGSIVALTDSTGKAVQTYEYDSFGNLKDLKNRVKQPFTYTGREWDKKTGLYYYRARYYDPMEGRFIQKDPIGFEGGDSNLYGYVGNNVINYTDPTGLIWPSEGKIVGNWCGGNWTGGRKEEYSPIRNANGYYKDPLSDLDSACKIHDICYYNCRKDFPCDKKSRGQCFLVCDAALDDAALTFGGFKGNFVSAGMRIMGLTDRTEPNTCSCGGILGE